MESKPKNREWVKNAAIVFLVILLILTFFSNTIMNIALPEVATQMVNSGTITAKVRGSGTVVANGFYEVKAKQTREIRSVMVRAGQQVNAGDVLFVLGSGDSEELAAAQEELRSLEVSYQTSALSSPVYHYETELAAIEDAKQALAESETRVKMTRAVMIAKTNISPEYVAAVDKELIDAQNAKDEVSEERQKLAEAEKRSEERKASSMVHDTVTEEEIAAMREAQGIAEAALAETLPLIRPGMSEREIAAELVYRMLRHGSEGNSFDPIVITGKKTSMPHGVPGDELVAEGDFVTMDFGCIKRGYCSDMTRTVAVGHATEEMRSIYSVVLEAQLAGIAAARAGIPGRDIDAAARAVITRAGYGEYFGHGFGHSLGLDIHESPNANTRGEALMPVGAVVSAEPGIYLPGRFGVRIEDVMVLREDGAEVITRAPKAELIVLGGK